MISGGEVDTERMARILLEEYRAGKLGRFTLRHWNHNAGEHDLFWPVELENRLYAQGKQRVCGVDEAGGQGPWGRLTPPQ